VRIPNGRVASGTQLNTGWSWHLEEVTFAEVTIELSATDDLPTSSVREPGRRRTILPLDGDGLSD